MRCKILAAVFMISFLLAGARAEIMISQPKAVYNIGDIMDISAGISASSSMNDFIEMSLACGSSSKVFYLSPVSLAAGQEEKIDKKLKLSEPFLNGMGDLCAIFAKYNSEEYASQSFRISRKIAVSVSADRASLKPNENVEIKGNAVKENSENANGFIELSVDGAGIKIISSVTNGKINLNFSFPDNAKSGIYKAKARVYEKSGEEITNEGESDIVFGVKQEPRKLEIISDRQSIIPGESLKIKTIVYDQAGDEISGDVKLEIKDSSEKVFLSKLEKSGEETEINFKENDLPGFWKISSSGFGLNAEKDISVEQLEKAKFEILNSTLVISNVGNVPYKKSVQIEIGQDTKIVEMNLGTGSSKTLRLTGDGNYDVSVSDGQETAVFKEIGLTGGAIGVSEMKGNLMLINKYPIVWLFLIAVFGIFIFTMSQRIIKKRFYEYTPKDEKRSGSSLPNIAKVIKNEGVVNLSRKVEDAELSLVMHGNKEEAGIVVLKLKNYEELSKNPMALESAEKAFNAVVEHRGAVNKAHGTFTGIFVPSATKTYKNDIAAVRAASAIAAELNEHNKKAGLKVSYGIGINSGELATSIEQGKLKFTALGNSIGLAKKIADTAQNNVLVSENTNKKVMSEVKTLKQGEFYSISRIIEREQNKEFINKFVERNKL